MGEEATMRNDLRWIHGEEVIVAAKEDEVADREEQVLKVFI